MAFQLTPEQEARIRSLINRGECQSVEQFVDAALGAFEEQVGPRFEGSDEELKALILEGLATQKLTEAEFWDRVNSGTAQALAEYQRSRRA